MAETSKQNITAMLSRWAAGDGDALRSLLPIVEEELRRLARAQLAGERPGHLLQATALVNEAYLRMVDVHHVQWQNRAQFFGLAARLMRRILVDAARAQHAEKRGGRLLRVTFDDALPVTVERPAQLIALDDALEALAAASKRKSEVVELRYFGGLTVEETAEALAVSRETVLRDWKFAKTWLLRELSRTARAGYPPVDVGTRPRAG